MQEVIEFALWLNIQRICDAQYIHDEEEMIDMYQRYLQYKERLGDGILDKRKY